MEATFVSRFMALFEAVNASVWPLHFIAYAIAAGLLVPVLRGRGTSRFVYLGLATLWLLAAVVFHWMYFGSIAKSGRYLAALFVLQSLMFAAAALRRRTEVRFHPTPLSWFGLSLVMFALIGYPAAGYLLRGSWLRTAWIGVFPCPVGLFTLGWFLLTPSVVPPYLLVIPTLWAAAAVYPVSWGIAEDAALLIGGLAASALVLYRDWHPLTTFSSARPHAQA